MFNLLYSIQIMTHVIIMLALNGLKKTCHLSITLSRQVEAGVERARHTLAAAHLCPVDGEVVLGASLCVGVVHQRQVSQSCAPLSRSLLSGAPPQQAYSHICCVVVLKGDLLDLKHTVSPVRHRAPPPWVKMLNSLVAPDIRIWFDSELI